MRNISVKIGTLSIILFGLSLTLLSVVHAEEEFNIYQERLALYKKTETLTHIPWYYLAAMDHYERNKEKTSPDEEELISIQFEPDIWYGPGNIDYSPNIKNFSVGSVKMEMAMGKLKLMIQRIYYLRQQLY